MLSTDNRILQSIYKNLGSVYTTLVAHIFLYAVVSSFVLIQILLAQECFIALSAFKRTWPYFMRFHMSLVCVLGREILTASIAYVWTNTRVCVDMLLQQVLRTKTKTTLLISFLIFFYLYFVYFVISIFISVLYLYRFPHVSQGHDFT